MLDEHAPRPSDDPPPSDVGTPNQDPEEIKLVKAINKKFEKSAKYRQRYDKDWINNYNMFRGRQWQKERPSYRHSEIINFIFQTIQSMVPIMTDARPRIFFLPQEPNDLEFSNILNQLLESDWDKGNWSFKLTELLYDDHFYGTGFSSLLYDHEGDFGFGCLKYKSEDPFDMYPDPDAEDVNECGDYFIKGKPVSIDKLKKKYAGHKYESFLKPDLEDLSSSKKTQDLMQLRKNTDLDIATNGVRYVSQTAEAGKDKALVLEIFFKPTDTEQVPSYKQNESGEYVPETTKNDKDEDVAVLVTKQKYPKGRRCVVINDLLFEDEPNPYDDGEFPFSRNVNYILPREFYGISEVEQLASPQKIFNKIICFTLDVLTLMGNPVWIKDSTAMVEGDKLINKPGLIITKAPGAEVKRVEGTQLQPYVLQLIDRVENWFNSVAGNQDISQGIAPAGVTANAAIENLMSASQTRIRQKMRNMDGYLQSVGRQYVSRVLQFYTTPRVFRLTNNQNTQQFFKFHVEKRPLKDANGLVKKLSDGTQEMETVAHVRNYNESTPGKLAEANQDQEYIVRGGFDVKVNTSSGLPFHKDDKEQRLFKLYELKVIDEKELLTQLEYPNAEAVIIRMQKRQEEMAKQQPPPKGA